MFDKFIEQQKGKITHLTGGYPGEPLRLRDRSLVSVDKRYKIQSHPLIPEDKQSIFIHRQHIAGSRKYMIKDRSLVAASSPLEGYSVSV
jgi:hypothetical protein